MKIYKQGHGNCEPCEIGGKMVKADYELEMIDKETSEPYFYNVCESCLAWIEDEMFDEIKKDEQAEDIE